MLKIMPISASDAWRACASRMMSRYREASTRLYPPVRKAMNRSTGCRHNHLTPSAISVRRSRRSAVTRASWKGFLIKTRVITDARYEMPSNRNENSLPMLR
jgi:hypothetical protein